jgi:hypothetical protein
MAEWIYDQPPPQDGVVEAKVYDKWDGWAGPVKWDGIAGGWVGQITPDVFHILEPQHIECWRHQANQS